MFRLPPEEQAELDRKSVRKKALEEEKAELEKNLAGLGLFAGTQKKAIKEKISALDEQLAELERQIAEQE